MRSRGFYIVIGENFYGFGGRFLLLAGTAGSVRNGLGILRLSKGRCRKQRGRQGNRQGQAQ